MATLRQTLQYKSNLWRHRAVVINKTFLAFSKSGSVLVVIDHGELATDNSLAKSTGRLGPEVALLVHPVLGLQARKFRLLLLFPLGLRGGRGSSKVRLNMQLELIMKTTNF